MSDQNNELNPAEILAADPTAITFLDHRCGHAHRHFVGVADSEAFIAWLEAHDCGFCALQDLANGIVLDRPLPNLTGDDPVEALRMDFFRREVLAHLVDHCSLDQRWIGANFARYDIALQTLCRRRAATWWGDLWALPGFSVTALIEQFATGTPRRPSFPAVAEPAVFPVPPHPYGGADFLAGDAESEFPFDPDADDFLEVFGAVIKDLRETWEVVKAGRGGDKPTPASRLTFLEQFDRQMQLLEQGYEQLEDLSRDADDLD